MCRPRNDSSATFTHSRTRPTVAPTTTTAAGAKKAICSSEYFVTQVPISQIATTAAATGRIRRPVHGTEGTLAAWAVTSNYVSGEDYVVEFLGYRFGFNALDFSERVTAAAVRLGLIESNALDDDETEDLVELAADGRIVEARSGLGHYVVRHWERVALVDGRVARLLAAKARVPRGVARPPRQGGSARGLLGRGQRRFRLCGAAWRPRAARARARAVLARAPVPPLTLVTRRDVRPRRACRG